MDFHACKGLKIKGIKVKNIKGLKIKGFNCKGLKMNSVLPYKPVFKKKRKSSGKKKRKERSGFSGLLWSSLVFSGLLDL